LVELSLNCRSDAAEYSLNSISFIIFDINSTDMNELLAKKTTDLSDLEIINEVKRGNIEYFSEIVKKYNQRMYRIAVSYGMDDDDCEEVIQLAYIAAYEKLNQFRGEAQFSTWLTRILINECLMVKRKQKKLLAVTERENVTISSGDHLNPESEYMDKERKEILEAAINKMPEKYKKAYILKEIEGMSIEQISDLLTISAVNVKVRLHRARLLLRDILGEITDVSSLFTFGNERCDRVTNAVMDYITRTK
jgi:RNA polymerase sigma factor (sigma-70 family)